MQNFPFNPQYELNSFEIILCEQQGDLFRECQYDFEVDALDFITKFMSSSLAAEYDRPVSSYHYLGIN